MANFALRVDEPTAGQDLRSTFLWLPSPSASTIKSNVDRNLSLLGPVSKVNLDLVRIAIGVFAADRSVLRERRGSNWNRRNIGLQVPVSDVDAWRSVAKDLEQLLAFLTGDAWAVTFVAAPPVQIAAQMPVGEESSPQRVVLMSGGADSAIGVLHSRSLLDDDQSQIVLSHYGATLLKPLQKKVGLETVGLLPGPGQRHVQVRLVRGSRRSDGSRWPSEPTSRSRSFLFLALGLAAASVDCVPLWIPENGFASLNPPLGSERLGSLSTKTTHPAFLGGLSALMEAVGGQGAIINPFAGKTKGEMFALCASLVGSNPASQFLSGTHSCAHAGQRDKGIAASKQCGVCFGCVLRRASFVAAGVSDQTQYISPSSQVKVQKWLNEKSVESAVRNFVARGVRARDLAVLGLPGEYSIEAALDLCGRGVAELGSLYT
jgi:hypothetical protein